MEGIIIQNANNNVNTLINEQIRFKELRIIGKDGSQLGIMSTREAMQIAYESELDLVLISQSANPPVAKIMDYNKYKFDLSKKQKEIKKNQKVVELKELRFSLNISENDLQTKAKHAEKFIKEGNKVKVGVKLFGREKARPEFAIELQNNFFNKISDIAQIEKNAVLEGRFVNATYAPKSTKK